MKEFISINEEFTQQMCDAIVGEDADQMPFEFVGSESDSLNGKQMMLENGQCVVLHHCVVKAIPYTCGYDCCGTSHYELHALGELADGV